MKYALLFLVVLAACTASVEPEVIDQPEIINQPEVLTMKVSSPAFTEDTSIPSPFTCDGENISPALTVGDLPEGTVSLALIMDDPDVPRNLRADGLFVHWVEFNIPPDADFAENLRTVGVQGANTRGDLGYTGPCPPDREHRYFFKIYALDAELDLPEGATKEQVEAAMEGHILDQAQLMGRYNRK